MIYVKILIISNVSDENILIKNNLCDIKILTKFDLAKSVRGQ